MTSIRQLVSYFVPDNYQLDLTIDKAKRQFEGQVIISGQPQAKEIRLHAKGLTILSINTAANPSPSWQQVADEVIIDDQSTQITVNFAGHISETAMNGLYLCKYKLNGQNKELFATQFESHYARECFPCIDEPAAKATFDVTIKSVDNDPVVLSNMPGHLVDGVWHFATTPCMSTYLLAFVGGDLISRSQQTKRGTTINVYASPAQPAKLLDYPLDIAVKAVEFYENYFSVPYPLPKLDNVALPDFSAGAMENWGLITYRETALLADDHTAQSSREQIATIIAHEIAHQWFGNLVTMQWWNDLWLNESFASLMENTATDYIHPEYRVWDDFETNDVAAALGRDALPGVQAVQQIVQTPDEIATLFDGAIVYAKGERLLKMLRRLIGQAAFQRGLSDYFQRHQYGNTTADDLWRSLSQTTNYNIKKLMTPWLAQSGYPVVFATVKDQQLTLRQQAFQIGGQAPSNKHWSIPLFASVDSLPAIMDQPTITAELNLSRLDQPFQLNLGNDAHYIAKYDDQLFNRLANNFDQLAIADKTKLLRESLLLSLANMQDISQTVSLLKCIINEDNQAVLATAASIINSLAILVEPGTAAEAELKQFVGQLFARQYHHLFCSDHRLGLNDTKAQATVLGCSVFADHPAAIAYCQEQFNQQTLTAIPSDTRAVILRSVVKHGNHTIFNQLWQAYRNSQDADLKLDLAVGLTSTTSRMDASVLLSAAVEGLIKPQDVIYFVAYLLGNNHTRQLAWRWIRDNWSWIEQVFAGDMSYSDFIQIAGKQLQTPDELSEYDKFCAKLNNSALARTITVGHNDITNRIQWIQRNQPALARLLS